ncbi:hypothetical protein LSAT2_015696 [Lamellibrachia satsuma]|nr:hypothetical protein LSAT2_015696 [Lamellibrachia satsuma]
MYDNVGTSKLAEALDLSTETAHIREISARALHLVEVDALSTTEATRISTIAAAATTAATTAATASADIAYRKHGVKCDTRSSVVEALYCRKKKQSLDKCSSGGICFLVSSLAVRKNAIPCVRSGRTVHSPLHRSV